MTRYRCHIYRAAPERGQWVRVGPGRAARMITYKAIWHWDVYRTDINVHEEVWRGSAYSQSEAMAFFDEYLKRIGSQSRVVTNV